MPLLVKKHHFVPPTLALSGTDVYRWPVEVAAKIAVAKLSKSEIDNFMMCVADEMTIVSSM